MNNSEIFLQNLEAHLSVILLSDLFNNDIKKIAEQLQKAITNANV